MQASLISLLFICLACCSVAHGDALAEAITRADRLIGESPSDANAYFLRARLFVRLREHEKSIADLTKTIKLEPTRAQAYDERGSERLLAGDIGGSIEDFDRFLSSHPDAASHHWKRGIALYYAGRFKEGVKQFDDHKTVNPDDVENAVWRYLCMARAQDVAAARADLLPIEGDRRVPMDEIHKLYAGQGSDQDVWDAVKAGNPIASEVTVRTFYAHLYLGLFHEVAGDEKLAKEHLTKAADEYKIGHYMWDIARMHVDHVFTQKPESPGTSKPAAVKK